MSAKRRDANHKKIVETFRACGCSVLDLGDVGKGCPDLCIARNGITMLVEVKNADRATRKNQLTPQQRLFHSHWKGRIEIVTTTFKAAALAASMA